MRTTIAARRNERLLIMIVIMIMILMAITQEKRMADRKQRVNLFSSGWWLTSLTLI